MNDKIRNNRKHCPSCNARIHPLDLSDILLGHKRECPYCYSVLTAQTITSIALAVGSLAGVLITSVSGNWLPGLSAWNGFFAALLVGAILWVTPPGLVAGAPWVRIIAKDPDSAVLGVKRRAKRMAAIEANQASSDAR